ncbi:hypothetical protein GGR50DRAFT_59682 [Xylaria sp. CBS 124048]|nr:hypothetical protein GGR50DRAFT_59682 [Xylaria sp. CBS 124048]
MAASDPKTRIMAHMNREHGADLKRYLRAFNGVPSSFASDAQMIDLTLDTMTIKSASGVHSVLISPPMKSFADARVRLVDMAERAQETLGISDIRITRFAAPRGMGLATTFGVSLYFGCAAAVFLGLLRPKTTAWTALDQFFPHGAAGFTWLVETIFVPVALIHLVEAYWIARTRLAKYGVATGSALWCKWVLATFLGGFPAILLFDKVVREEREKKNAAKH